MTQEQINELRKLAEAATPGPWEVRAGVLRKIGEQPQIATIYRPYNSQFIAAANPAAVLELIDIYYGCKDALEAVVNQRQELLAALKDAREMVDDWGAYAPEYMQDKYDLQGDLDKLDAAITKAGGCS